MTIDFSFLDGKPKNEKFNPEKAQQNLKELTIDMKEEIFHSYSEETVKMLSLFSILSVRGTGFHDFIEGDSSNEVKIKHIADFEKEINGSISAMAGMFADLKTNDHIIDINASIKEKKQSPERKAIFEEMNEVWKTAVLDPDMTPDDIVKSYISQINAMKSSFEVLLYSLPEGVNKRETLKEKESIEIKEKILKALDDGIKPLIEVSRQLAMDIYKRRAALEEIEDAKKEVPKHKTLEDAINNNDMEEFKKWFTRSKTDYKSPENEKKVKKLVDLLIKTGNVEGLEVFKGNKNLSLRENVSDSCMPPLPYLFNTFEPETAKQQAQWLVDFGMFVGGYYGPQNDLHYMTFIESMEGIDFVVDNLGMDINSPDLFGHTALSRAIGKADITGDTTLVKYLLSKGADLNHKIFSEDNATPEEFTDNPAVIAVIDAHKAETLKKSKTP